MQNKSRTKKKNRSLKRLREILGEPGKPITQRQFAAMVGASLPSIKAVERGEYPIKPPLARKVVLATGAQLTWPVIRGGRLEHVPLPNGEIRWMPIGEAMANECMQTKHPGRAYTRTHFDIHRRFFGFLGIDWTNPAECKRAAERALERCMPSLRALFVAAAKPGVAGLNHRLPGLYASLENWMSKEDRAFKLTRRITAQKNGRPKPLPDAKKKTGESLATPARLATALPVKPVSKSSHPQPQRASR